MAARSYLLAEVAYKVDSFAGHSQAGWKRPNANAVKDHTSDRKRAAVEVVVHGYTSKGGRHYAAVVTKVVGEVLELHGVAGWIAYRVAGRMKKADGALMEGVR